MNPLKVFSTYVYLLILSTANIGFSINSYDLESRESYKMKMTIDQFFKSHDATSLFYSISLPVKKRDDEKFPLVILSNPLGVPAQIYQLTPIRKLLVKRGIAVVMLNSRGHSRSGGVAKAASQNEVEDISSFIDYALEKYPIDENSIGLGGMSNGAALTLMSAAQDERVKVAVAGSPWTSLMEGGFYENKTVNKLWADILPLAFSKKGGEFVRSLKNRIYQDPNGEFLRRFSEERNIYSSIQRINEKKIPTFIIGNIDESLFPLKNTLELYKALSVVKKLEIGRGDHVTTEMISPVFHHVGFGSKCNDSDVVWKKIAAWYLFWLKGSERSILDEDLIHSPVKSKKCVKDSFNDFSFNRVENRLYLSEANELVDHVDDIKKLHSSISVSNRGQVIGNGKANPVHYVLGETIGFGSRVDLRDVEREFAFVFKSKPVAQKIKLRSDFFIDLSVHSDHEEFQIFFYLLKKTKNSHKAHLLSISPFSNLKKNADDTYHLKFKMDFVSDDLEPGDVIYLAADTADGQYIWRNNAKSLSIISSPEKPSYISFKAEAEILFDEYLPENLEHCRSKNGLGYGRIYRCENSLCAKQKDNYSEACRVDYSRSFMSEMSIPYCRFNLGKGYAKATCPFSQKGYNCAFSSRFSRQKCIVVK